MTTSDAPPDFSSQILDRDTSLFRVRADLTEEDKISFLSIQKALRTKIGPYAYLEIGSFLGGSLQTFLIDRHCRLVYSIDSRPNFVDDERGSPRSYAGVTREQMLAELGKHYPGHLDKLRCFDTDTSSIDRGQVDDPPFLCFVDGEHTDDAVFRDFSFCLRVASRPCVILFHDSQVVFGGIQRCLDHLDAEAVPHYCYILPDYLTVVEIGPAGLCDSPAVLERMARSGRAMICQLNGLKGARDFYAAWQRNPVYRLGKTVRRLLRF